MPIQQLRHTGHTPPPTRLHRVAPQHPAGIHVGQAESSEHLTSHLDLTARFPRINGAFFQDPAVLAELKAPSNYVIVFFVWFADFFVLSISSSEQVTEFDMPLFFLGVIGLVLVSLALMLRRIFPVFAVAVTGLCALVAPISPAGCLISLTWVFGKRGWKEWVPATLVAALVCFVFIRLDVLRPEGLAIFDTVGSTTGTVSLASDIFYVGLGIGIGIITLIVAAYRRSRSRERVAQVTASQQADISNELFTKLNMSEERNVIAREIHDTVAHQLSRLAMQTSVLELNTEDEAVMEGLQDIRHTTQQTIEEMRGLISSLRDSDSEGYVGNVGNSLENVKELIAQARDAGASISADLSLVGASSMSKAVSRAAYRITQESITNAIKYSPDTPIFIRIRADEHSGIVLEAINVVAAERQATSHMLGTGAGLTGMRERAENLGGTFSAEQIDDFWRVSAYLPWTTETDPQ